jgi:hypothetical protein
MVLDDVALQHLPGAPAASAPVYLPLILRDHVAPPTSTPTPTSTATPTSTPTPTVTPFPTAIPTATPGYVPTPYWAGRLNLPAGSRPHGLAVNAAGDRVYVAFHGVDHSGHTLGVVNEYLSLQAQIDLGPAGQGPNGVALIPASGRVVVANRQTANASVVDPAAGAVVQTHRGQPAAGWRHRRRQLWLHRQLRQRHGDGVRPGHAGCDPHAVRCGA